MTDLTNPSYLRTRQYKDASRLNARVQLHARFSTNPFGWFRWVFEQYDLPPVCRILELGCGAGDLWRANLERIPAGWEITLSDFSVGMLVQARQNLAGVFPFTFAEIDAQSIPYVDGRFDAVIANFMLYHVPDRPRALAEIRRVLKPGGRLFATTAGENHMRESWELGYRFDPERAVDHLNLANEFTLENGLSQLQPFFSELQLHRYPDSLHVTEAEPLVDYILSTFAYRDRADVRPALLEFVEREMQRNSGAIDITKVSGMFIAEGK